jgi:hypothetical protein
MATAAGARAVTLGDCELPASDVRLLLSSPSCWLTDPLLPFYFEYLQRANGWRLQHCRFVSPQSAAVIMHEQGQPDVSHRCPQLQLCCDEESKREAAVGRPEAAMRSVVLLLSFSPPPALPARSASEHMKGESELELQQAQPLCLPRAAD